MRISDIINDSIVDGPGFRLTIFTQGCPHRCSGCHNPQTHDFAGGREVSIGEIYKKFEQNSLLSGITLSGGEPLVWAEPLAKLAELIQNRGKTVWLYSGYTFEQIMENSENRPGWKELIHHTDVLVDGLFREEERSLMLKFRGSKNQRIINVKESISTNKAVEMAGF